LVYKKQKVETLETQKPGVAYHLDYSIIASAIATAEKSRETIPSNWF
jgi:hypothetical protein